MAFRQTIPAPQARPRAPDFHVDPLLEKTTIERSRSQHLGLSPLSDFGSLNTVARSNEVGSISGINGDEGEDLDSLDLQAFQDPPLPASVLRLAQLSRDPKLDAGAILPAHDGLGMFSPSRTPNEIWARSAAGTAPNRYSNLKKTEHPAPPIEPMHVDNHRETFQLNQTRVERIEKWRLEQSEYIQVDCGHEKTHSQRQRRRLSRLHPDSSKKLDIVPPDAPHDASWKRTTYQVIQDLMGVDDSILCIILGEDLAPAPEEDTETSNVATSVLQKVDSPSQASTMPWRSRLVKQIRGELIKLAQQLSRIPCSRPDSESWRTDYAGMPVDWLLNRACAIPHRASTRSLTEITEFLPTFDTRPWKETPEVTSVDLSASNKRKTTSCEVTFWQQFSTLRLLLRKLYRAWIGQTWTLDNEQHESLVNLSHPEAIRRAAMIQQYHPLVAQLTQRSPQSDSIDQFRSSSANSRLFALGPNLKRSGETCGSLKTKRSRRTSSEGESRNYWNLGGSIGTASAVFAGVGAWGEL